jgi:(p)ppGpp synthase/HD superfamily hydrolase
VENEGGYSERYEQALRVAATAHRHQNRKAGDLPYITHVVHVSVILLHYGFPTDVAIAGLLHDVVEDQGYELSQIGDRFGERVAEIVAAVSERKTDAQGAKRPWDVRKREAVAHMRRASLEAVAVKAADALHNARCIALDVRRDGPTAWQRFNRGPGPQLDYYRQVVEVARERLQGHPLVDELADGVEDLTRAVDEVSEQVHAGSDDG